MAEIEVHFTDFFDGETVVISSADGELYRAEHLKTDLRKGLAKIVQITAPRTSTLDFALADGKERTSVKIDIAHLKYLAVSLAQGRLHVSAVSQEDYKREPRGYA